MQYLGIHYSLEFMIQISAPPFNLLPVQIVLCLVQASAQITNLCPKARNRSNKNSHCTGTVCIILWTFFAREAPCRPCRCRVPPSNRRCRTESCLGSPNDDFLFTISSLVSIFESIVSPVVPCPNAEIRELVKSDTTSDA